MYKCAECGAVFEEPYLVKLYHEETPEDAHETLSCCPICHSCGIEDAERCEVCGEWCIEKEMIMDVCVDCLNSAMKDYEVMSWFFRQDDNLEILADNLAWRARKNGKKS